MSAIAHSDDEDDYMSDKLIQQLEDVRPGLPMKKSQQRDLQAAKRKAKNDSQSKTKKRHLIEEEQRREGLAKPIDETNKGYNLLARMGFKPGMPLGSGASSTQERIAEPIEVKMKTDGRGGLGMATKNEEESKERARKHLDAAAKTDCIKMSSEFRKTKLSRFEERLVKGDLSRSQRVCRQLDLEHGVSTPGNKLFWPPDDETDSSLVDEDNEEPIENDAPQEEDTLKLITNYLRTKYFYCVWCGCRFQDSNDLMECPGDNRDAHDE